MKNLFRGQPLDLSRLIKTDGVVDVAALLEKVLPGRAKGPAASPISRQAEALPKGAQFIDGSFTNAAGTRPYKLYVPGGDASASRGLIVMLHGCSQSPADFAAGTRMNHAAETAGYLVLYPEQVAAANANGCWNWFSPGDQQRGQGEPSLIAGMTREVMQRYGADPRRVFAAGLSAGAAAAVVLGFAYPELFAAIGVHSGLALGSAHDFGSAFSAMRQGRPGTPARPGVTLPMIVFQGDQDHTVNPANAAAVVAQSGAVASGQISTEGRAPGGRTYTRTLHADRGGRTLVEQWTVHGAGHAWSGGSPDGSFTDPQGPDATREMLRFFQDQARHSLSP